MLEVVTARLEHELSALKKRIHLREGFEKIFDVPQLRQGVSCASPTVADPRRNHQAVRSLCRAADQSSLKYTAWRAGNSRHPAELEDKRKRRVNRCLIKTSEPWARRDGGGNPRRCDARTDTAYALKGRNRGVLRDDSSRRIHVSCVTRRMGETPKEVKDLHPPGEGESCWLSRWLDRDRPSSFHELRHGVPARMSMSGIDWVGSRTECSNQDGERVVAAATSPSRGDHYHSKKEGDVPPTTHRRR